MAGGGHHHGHGHAHAHELGGAATRAGARHRRRLAAALAIVVGFLVVEGAAGFATGSLALLSDAGHMLTDALGLGMALAAIHLASRRPRRLTHTFGMYRLEILAALANALLLFGVAAYVLMEAATRLSNPPPVPSGVILLVATGALVANLVAFFLLRSGAKESLNVEGAYLEVLADTVGSAAVLLAGLLMRVTGWRIIDPLVGAGIGIWILPRTWRLGRQALRILVQAAPPGVDLAAVEADLRAVPGVVDVHDLHLWTLTSEMEVASAHVMVQAQADIHAVLDTARAVLRDRYAVAHATLQVEPETHEGCEEVDW